MGMRLFPLERRIYVVAPLWQGGKRGREWGTCASYVYKFYRLHPPVEGSKQGRIPPTAVPLLLCSGFAARSPRLVVVRNCHSEYCSPLDNVGRQREHIAWGMRLDLSYSRNVSNPSPRQQVVLGGCLLRLFVVVSTFFFK